MKAKIIPPRGLLLPYQAKGHSDRFWALALALHATTRYVSAGAMVVYT